MIRRPPRSTLSSSSAASDVYKRQVLLLLLRILMSAWEQVGLLVGCTKLDHSCDPSCRVERVTGSDAPTVRVYTTRQLEPGSLLTVDYLELCGVRTHGLHVTERRAQLKLRWGFECQCTRCCAEHLEAETESTCTRN
eukprot:TRINITY_DN7415_c0_g1_i3.p1 TRINITY_DN7415_c0_g1~~TRINITY_DN7415_c0_g1_i3.p1  ORF type:complete len:137 (+),score=26.10 TRINITY_DN7415_c0_g1_i3:132-542(+)